MSFTPIDFSKVLKPICFAVEQLFAFGYVSFAAAREGVGKTTILTALLWQMSRPNGGEWLGITVRPAKCLFINTDSPDGESRGVRYWLEMHQNAYPDGDFSQITVIEEAALDETRIAALEEYILEHKFTVVILDSYMGAFPGLDPKQMAQQMMALILLRDMAARTKVALIVADHLPKHGSPDGKPPELIGSVAKGAQSRAVVRLTRVPPKECEGKNVVKLEVLKQSYARILEPFGFEIAVAEGEQGRQVKLEPYDLPDESQNTGKGRGKSAVTNYLQLHMGLWHSKAALLKVAIEFGNVQERQAEKALKEAIEQFGERLEKRKLGRDKPLEYRLKALLGDPEHSENEPESPVKDPAPFPNARVQTIKNGVSDDAHCLHTPIANGQGVQTIEEWGEVVK